MVGGRFEIESLPGKGTTIRVTIPTAKARAGSDKNPKQETSFACHRFDCPRRLVKDSLLEPVQTQP
jgi:hypothetical protein